MRGPYSEFIPKEVAVVSIDQPYTAHWIIIPPCRYSELPENSRSQNNYLTRSFHGLEWFVGNVTSRQVYANFREISRESRTIITRGHDKAALLREITSREIIDLEEDEDVSAFDHMPIPLRKCCRHGLMRGEFAAHCALQQAFRINNWLHTKPREMGIYGNPWNDRFIGDLPHAEEKSHDEGDLPTAIDFSTP